MTDDPFHGKEWEEYADRVIKELVPMVRDAAVTMAVLPGWPHNLSKADVRMAVEIGFMVLMDKPIIVVVSPGVEVPAKLVAVADVIVEGLGAPDFTERIAAAIAEVTSKLDGDSST